MRKPFLIPTSFQLHGQTVTVRWDETLNSKDDARGLASFRGNEIRLQPRTDSVPAINCDIEQAFCHEMVHWILHQMDHKLNDNEAFVNLFANLLHQALTTAEYEKAQ